MFNVEIRGDDGKWFVAHNGAALSAVEADAMILELRAQGFTARGRFADES